MAPINAISNEKLNDLIEIKNKDLKFIPDTQGIRFLSKHIIKTEN